MPVQRITLGRAPVPVPLDGFPEMRNPIVQIALLRIWAIEVLARGEQTFHQESRFDKITGIVEHAKQGQRLSGSAIHKMRPYSVVARRLFEEGNDLCQPLEALLARNETSMDTHDDCHDAEAARAGGDDTIVAWSVLQSHSRLRVRGLPVVAETGFLQHGEEFLIAHGFGRGACFVGKGRQMVLAIRGRYFVSSGQPRLTQIVGKPIDSLSLNTNRFEIAVFERTINYVAPYLRRSYPVPLNVNMAFVAFR